MTSAPAFEPYAITRPASSLLWYYALTSLAAGPFFPFVLIPLYFKYETLRYKFDEKGVSMTWGILFRRETVLTYRRIQDIHLTRNIVQRWMGLASVAIQTASGNAGAEMTIEGILEAEPLRDFLYAQMRGARGLDDARRPLDTGAAHPQAAAQPAVVVAAVAAPAAVGSPGPSSHPDELLTVLGEIRDALARLSRKEGAS